MKKTALYSAPYSRKADALPAAKAAERNSRSGSIGWAARPCRTTKPAASASPAAIAPITSALDHPAAALPRTSPQTRPSVPPAASSSPTTSIPAGGPTLSTSRARAAGTRTRPTGTFSQKIHRQSRPWVTAPPTSGPAATASPVSAANRPSARPRDRGGKAAESSAIASGITSAAPAPCTTLAAINQPTPGDRAQAADAAVNRARPQPNRRRRPHRSPRAAPVISRTANVTL